MHYGDGFLKANDELQFHSERVFEKQENAF